MDFKTVKEIWEAYPLDFVDYRREWAWEYNKEEERILEYREKEGFEAFIRMGHIGSTAVVGMRALPVIDILLEVREGADLAEVKKDLKKLGYRTLDYPEGESPYILGYRGYGGPYVYHIQLRYLKKWDDFYLRDHLNRNKLSREEYESVRMELREKHRGQRKDYEKERQAYIEKYVDLEKREYEAYLRQLNAGFEE